MANSRISIAHYVLGKMHDGRKVVGVQSTMATVSRDAHWLLERS